MPPKSKDGPVISTSRGEVLRFKSPAEFFSENKNIAGFDNPGKSLYTTVRELVENSLDACESINVLPEIDITIEEMDRAALNKLIGVKSHARLDDSLFASDAPKKGKKAAAAAASSAAADAGDDDDAGDGAAGKGGGGGGKAAKGDMFYRVVVKDNGCGMKHENIPNMLGRVLSVCAVSRPASRAACCSAGLNHRKP